MTEMMTSRDDVSTTAYDGLNNDSYDYYYDHYDAGELRFYYVLWTIATPIVFALITVVGVIGNLIVVMVIVTRPSRRQSPTNILLLNLAIADLAFLTAIYGQEIVHACRQEWLPNDRFCRDGRRTEPEPNRTLVLIELKQNRTRTMRVILRP